MKKIDNNYDKYLNYKFLMERIQTAFDSEFYFEVILIAYSILEDRAKSIIIHSHLNLNDKDGLAKKTRIIRDGINIEKIDPKYFDIQKLDELDDWRVSRNRIIHALPDLKYKYNNELVEIAKTGLELSKYFANKSTNIRRMNN